MAIENSELSKAGGPAVQFLPNAYLRGKILPFEEAHVSIATHALHYGTAAFAGMRVYADAPREASDGSSHNSSQAQADSNSVRLFRPELHVKRLSQSAKLLGHDISSATIRQAVEQFLAANPANESYYMRPLVYVSDLGIAPRLHGVEFDLLIYGVKMEAYLSEQGISCCFSSWIRGEDRSLPLRGKISGTYVTSALAKSEAAARGFDEAILLNTRGKIAEGSAMNVFMVKDGVLTTPPVTADILEGITRRSVLEIAAELDIPTEEREIDRSELLLAEEVFLTGTATQIAPINKIEQYGLPANRPVTEKVVESLKKIIDREPSVHTDWMVSFKAAPPRV